VFTASPSPQQDSTLTNKNNLSDNNISEDGNNSKADPNQPILKTADDTGEPTIK
jgi:hypothetical protein